jgi:carbonic anhydrase
MKTQTQLAVVILLVTGISVSAEDAKPHWAYSGDAGPVKASAEQLTVVGKTLGHANNRPVQPAGARIVVK